jgi:hypothetical protein
VTECAETPVRKFSECRKPEPLFSGIDINNTSPSPTEFWVIMHSETYFI